MKESEARRVFENDIRLGGDLPRELTRRDEEGEYVNGHVRLAWANFRRGWLAAERATHYREPPEAPPKESSNE